MTFMTLPKRIPGILPLLLGYFAAVGGLVQRRRLSIFESSTLRGEWSQEVHPPPRSAFIMGLMSRRSDSFGAARV
jgi:hypothetical protein